MKSRKSFFKLYDLRPFITRRSNKQYLIDFLRNICGFYLVKYLARLLRNNAFNSILALLRPGEDVQQSYNSILALLRPGEDVQQSSNSILALLRPGEGVQQSSNSITYYVTIKMHNTSNLGLMLYTLVKLCLFFFAFINSAYITF